MRRHTCDYCGARAGWRDLGIGPGLHFDAHTLTWRPARLCVDWHACLARSRRVGLFARLRAVAGGLR